ncbi:MAG TPA: class I SAM-dependent methyltransferase [Flavisolibacter sp.]|nr:class I SAM-dependent methyltransferase [Flavisolibacter sp.]
MRKCFLAFTVLASLVAAAQGKREKQGFCGVSYTNLKMLKEQLAEQFEFLKVQEHDTIVDVGAASGWYEGAFGAGSGINELHFVLVDLDTTCMNKKKVEAAMRHYSEVKGSPISYTFDLVHNSPDSLWLPLRSYKKLWLLNMLHEVPDQDRMVRGIRSILQPGGEVVLLEIIPKKKGQLHGGCKKPLMEPEACTALFERNGFQQKDAVRLKKVKRHIDFSMMRFINP